MATHFSPSERQNYFKSVNFYPSASFPLVYFEIFPFHLDFYPKHNTGRFHFRTFSSNFSLHQEILQLISRIPKLLSARVFSLLKMNHTIIVRAVVNNAFEKKYMY